MKYKDLNYPAAQANINEHTCWETAQWYKYFLVNWNFNLHVEIRIAKNLHKVW